MSFEAAQFADDNCTVYHLFKDLLSKDDAAAWFDNWMMVMDVLHIYVYMITAFVKSMTCTAPRQQPQSVKTTLVHQKQRSLLRSVSHEKMEQWRNFKRQDILFIHCNKNIRLDDVQIQTTIGIIWEKNLVDFKNACMALSQTISTQFLMIDQVRVNGNIGATLMHRRPGQGRGQYHPMHNPTPVGTCTLKVVKYLGCILGLHDQKCDKLNAIGAHLIVFNQRKHEKHWSCGRQVGRGLGRGQYCGWGWDSTPEHNISFVYKNDEITLTTNCTPSTLTTAHSNN